jgi:hypothetical protein
VHGQCHRAEGCVREPILPKLRIDAREWPRMHGPLKRGYGVWGILGHHDGSTCGETRHGISHPLLEHALFPLIFGGLPCERDPWRCWHSSCMIPSLSSPKWGRVTRTLWLMGAGRAH